MAAVVVTEPVTRGLVIFSTTGGDLSIELWPKEAPKACRNFLQLCMEGYFEGCTFHRVVPDFIIQTGDPTSTGAGGESIWDEPFEDEFNPRLRFSRRGLVAMANEGPNSNRSQFFITLSAAEELNQKNTIFGTLAGDTVYNALQIGNESELHPESDKPMYPVKITGVKLVDNPLEDIVPRITAEERHAQAKAKRQMERERRARDKGKGKKKGVKNAALLSMAMDDEGEEEATPAPRKGFKSSFDANVIDVKRASASVDDRSLLANMPPELMNNSSDRVAQGSVSGKRKEREEEEPPAAKSKKLSRDDSPPQDSISKGTKASVPEVDKVKAEIARVSANLKKQSRGVSDEEESDDEDAVKKAKKQRRDEKEKARQMGANLLLEERNKYLKSNKARGGHAKSTRSGGDGIGTSTGKNKSESQFDSKNLTSFTKKLEEAKKQAARERKLKKEEEKDKDKVDREGLTTAEEAEMESSDDDTGWMEHKLQFRKDATEDMKKLLEYEVIDPRANPQGLSLDEMKRRDAGKRRQHQESSSRGGGSRHDRRHG